MSLQRSISRKMTVASRFRGCESHSSAASSYSDESADTQDLPTSCRSSRHCSGNRGDSSSVDCAAGGADPTREDLSTAFGSFLIVPGSGCMIAPDHRLALNRLVPYVHDAAHERVHGAIVVEVTLALERVFVCIIGIHGPGGERPVLAGDRVGSLVLVGPDDRCAG
jgi:hypothetical protein